MTIQDYCTNEMCERIKMRYEYILIHEDKYVFSYINKGNEIDIKTMPQRHLLSMFVLPLFLIIPFIILKDAIFRYEVFFISLYTLIIFSVLAICFYQFFYVTSTSVIEKDKVMNVYISKRINSVYIKYRNNKKRGIMLPIDKQERELALQLLRKHKILQS
jgi:hypothetical protein